VKHIHQPHCLSQVLTITHIVDQYSVGDKIRLYTELFAHFVDEVVDTGNGAGFAEVLHEEVEGVGVRRAVFGGEFFDQFNGVVKVGGGAQGADRNIGRGGVRSDAGGVH